MRRTRVLKAPFWGVRTQNRPVYAVLAGSCRERVLQQLA